MEIGPAHHRYEWIENWARIPDTESGRENGRTHGIVVTGEGRVMVFHQASPAVLVFDENGRLENSWGERFAGAHGMTLVREGQTEYLWLTDQKSAEVVRTTLDGETVMNLERPEIEVYEQGGKYTPTWVAVNDPRHGGNGDLWVADGYGSSYVHRYDAMGRYLSSLNGEEGAGRFACPHAVYVDARGGAPELYVADRGNQRVQVYDGEGRFLRAFGEDYLTSPCMFATWGDEMYIPELFARLTILDGSDQLVGHVGENPEARQTQGWPNVPSEQLEPGRFNSPHGMAADEAGNLYVAEWIIGGRITKLRRTG